MAGSRFSPQLRIRQRLYDRGGSALMINPIGARNQRE
jgi:hypothetical protein